MSATGFAAPLKMPTNNGEAAVYGDDRSLLVNFYTEAVFQEATSKKEGRPVYKDEVFVHVVMPGGKSDFRGRAHMEQHDGIPSDPERFPRAWARFQNQQKEVSDGLPLDQWAPMPKAEVMGFKAQGTHTVEQLAAIPDSALHNFGMNGRRWRDMAINFLKNADGGKEVARLTSENAQLRADIDALKAQFKAFTNEDAPEVHGEVEQAPRRGRPPKNPLTP